MSNFYPNLYNPANAALLASDRTILPGVATPTANRTGASPGLITSPNPILKGVQFYVNGHGDRRPRMAFLKVWSDNHWAAFGPRVGFAYDV